jgi:hypothetical protein
MLNLPTLIRSVDPIDETVAEALVAIVVEIPSITTRVYSLVRENREREAIRRVRVAYISTILAQRTALGHRETFHLAASAIDGQVRRYGKAEEREKLLQLADNIDRVSHLDPNSRELILRGVYDKPEERELLISALDHFRKENKVEDLRVLAVRQTIDSLTKYENQDQDLQQVVF